MFSPAAKPLSCIGLIEKVNDDIDDDNNDNDDHNNDDNDDIDLDVAMMYCVVTCCQALILH